MTVTAVLVLAYALPITAVAAAASTLSCGPSDLVTLATSALALRASYSLACSAVLAVQAALASLTARLAAASCVRLAPQADPADSPNAQDARDCPDTLADLIVHAVLAAGVGGLTLLALVPTPALANDLTGWAPVSRAPAYILMGWYTYLLLLHPSLTSWSGSVSAVARLPLSQCLPHVPVMVAALASSGACALPPFTLVPLVSDLVSALALLARILEHVSAPLSIAVYTMAALAFIPGKILLSLWLLLRVASDSGSISDSSRWPRALVIAWALALLWSHIVGFIKLVGRAARSRSATL